jgi:hypothetical protein
LVFTSERGARFTTAGFARMVESAGLPVREAKPVRKPDAVIPNSRSR